MKVYISVDMEGISGVVHNEHTSERGYDYDLARRLMMGEANAAVEGAVEAGATEVLVSDSHGGNGARNLIIDTLHPAADLVTGFPRPLGQLAGLDSDYVVLLLVGYHTRSNAAGVINHTVHGRAVNRLTIGGRELGEIGINALLAGQVGVPVGLVTGDELTCAEGLDLLPGIETATVKWTVDRYAARCLSPRQAQAAVRTATERAVRKARSLKPFAPKHPATWEIQYKDSGMAEVASQVSGTTMIQDDTIAYEAPDPSTGFKTFTAALAVAAGTLLR
jgi:D-amino peptidase